MTEFAGSLNQRIELWAHSQERLPSGTASQEREFLLSCRAAIVLEGFGTESEAMSLSAMPRYRLAVRKLPDFSVGHQVRWRGRNLLIRQVVDDPVQPDRLILRCEEQR
ncbi:phage head completion protein [Sphingomonas humi]|uniref:phage head completion protein n=1 Tax=Sphingomonas humi TaxID=335630 RepID=UPI0031D3598F